MTGTIRSVVLAVLIVASAFTGAALAASNGSISADPAEPGATSTHTVRTTVGDASAGTWYGLKVNYQGTGADVSGVSKADIVKIGIDRGDDESGTTIDVNASDDLTSVSSSTNGETLTSGSAEATVSSPVTNWSSSTRTSRTQAARRATTSRSKSTTRAPVGRPPRR